MSKRSFSKIFSSNKASLKNKFQANELFDAPDEELMLAYKQGQTEVFQVLLSRYQKSIYNFVLRFIKNSETADEIFQEVFLRIVKSAQDYEVSAKFSTWLYTVARNCCIDKLRKEKFRNHVSLEQKISDENESGTLQDMVSFTLDNAEDVSRVNQLTDYLKEILDELSLDQKEVFVMREFQNLSFDQIAAITKESVNTVKSRMRYALKSIQKKFAEKGIHSF